MNNFMQHQGGNTTSNAFTQHQGGNTTSNAFMQHQGGNTTSNAFTQHQGGNTTSNAFMQHQGGNTTSNAFMQYQGGNKTGDTFTQYQEGNTIGDQFTQHQGSNTTTYHTLSVVKDEHQKNNFSNDIQYNNIKELKELILSRLRGIKREGIEKLLDFIENSTDYFEAPASTKYHSNCEGGLAIHSHNVVELLLEKNVRYNLGLTEESIFIIGYMHDLCKTNFYKLGPKWKKINQQWMVLAQYQVSDDFPMGHGEKSVIMLQKYIQLSDIEALMIRYHMGPEGNQDYQYYNACKKYPEICSAYTADFEASTYFETIFQPQVYTKEQYESLVAIGKALDFE